MSKLARDRDTLAALVAQMYYTQEAPTQQEIGRVLGLDKTRVNRLLKYARQRNLFEIQICIPRQDALELKLRQTFGLTDVRVFSIVPPTCTAYIEYRRYLGEAAARYLEKENLPFDECKIGLGCGSTLRHVLQHLSEGRYTGVHISQLAVESETSVAIDSCPFALVAMLYAKWNYRSQAYAIHPPPGVLGTNLIRPYLDQIESRARDLDLALVGIGHLDRPDNSGTFFEMMDGHDISYAEFARRGVVGEICNRPFDKDGRDLFDQFPTISNYATGVSLDILKQLVERGRKVVAVAGGSRKAPAIRVALEQRIVNCLLTDMDAAETLCNDTPTYRS